jgi:hypothetical protein
LAIDFTVEPGTVTSGGATESGDPQWAAGVRPLARQIGEFLAARKAHTNEAATQALLGSVTLAERCHILLRLRQRDWVRPTRATDELHYALRDLLAGRFYDEGIGRPGDARALNLWVEGKMRQFRAKDAEADIESL